MIDQHLRDLRGRGSGYSEATVKRAEVWLCRLQVFCAGRCPSQLRATDLVAWQKELTWTPGPAGKLYSESSVFQAVGAVRRFYRWALFKDLVKTDPTGLLVTRAAKRTRTNRLELTVTEARRLLASTSLETPVGIRDRAIFGVLLETEISKPACSGIDLAHLQFDTGALLTKGRGQQIHSLSAGLLGDIERYLRQARPLLFSSPNQALFLNIHGDRISAPSIYRALRQHQGLSKPPLSS